ncbi:MAG: tetratricopeptide repeat protein, partial [Myxococcota bacterium]|nr:tetratricopeptide repeat protein [Myxococcota bacterium]
AAEAPEPAEAAQAPAPAEAAEAPEPAEIRKATSEADAKKTSRKRGPADEDKKRSSRSEEAPDPPSKRGFDALMKAGRKAESRDPAKAAKHYQEALNLRPKDPDAMGSVGRTLFRAGQNGKAITVLKRCRSTRARFGPCMYWLGRAYEKSGDASKARDLYEKYLSDYPDGSYAAKARQRLSP